MVGGGGNDADLSAEFGKTGGAAGGGSSLEELEESVPILPLCCFVSIDDGLEDIETELLHVLVEI